MRQRVARTSENLQHIDEGRTANTANEVGVTLLLPFAFYHRVRHPKGSSKPER